MKDPSSSFRFIEGLVPRLRWRNPLQGTSPGQGGAPLRSGSGEFEEHTRWCPGDDLSQLDLKAWLRLRQRWTRTHRDDSSEPLTILIDGGPSMGFGPRGSTVEILRRLLRSMARAQHDPCREWILTDGNARWIGADEDPSQQRRGSISSALREVHRTASGPGRVIVISDRISIDDPHEHLQGLLRLGTPIWISPWLGEEVSPVPLGTVRLEATDEPGWSGTIDNTACRRYRQQFDQQRKRLQLWLTRRGGLHLHLDAAEAGETLLRPLLHRSGPLEVVAG